MSDEMVRNQLNRDRAMFEGAGMAKQVAAVDEQLAALDAAAAEAAADAEGEAEDAWESVTISPAARARADELGLTAEDFKRRRASGKSGFVVADVDRIAEALGKGEAEGEAENGDD
jgi:hypothetical protein